MTSREFAHARCACPAANAEESPYHSVACNEITAALAAAEQRASNLEEKWGEAAARAELAEQRADRAEDDRKADLFRIRRAIADILRES